MNPPNTNWVKVEVIREVVLLQGGSERQIVYGLTDRGGVYVIDWSDPAAAVVVGQYFEPGWDPKAIVASDEALFVCDASQGGRVVILPGQDRSIAATGTPAPGAEGPLTHFLGPGIPNPFISSTRLGFVLGRAERIQLVVHDLSGRVVRHLVDGALEAGEHTFAWDGRDDGGRRVGSGVYFARLAGERRSDSRRLTLVR
jgi:hypothetical protein